MLTVCDATRNGERHFPRVSNKGVNGPMLGSRHQTIVVDLQANGETP